MTFITKLVHSAAFVATATVGLCTAQQARAIFTLTGTAPELVARGINANFETPAQTRGDGENALNGNLGGGWTHNLVSGTSNTAGVQDPGNPFYGQATNTTPLPAPFEGLQIGFFNLNTFFSQAEVVSAPIGKLRSGETYTLNVGVGMRARTQLDWPSMTYRIGLRASDGTDLGTFSTHTMTQIATAVLPNAPNVFDLQYTLNANSFPSYIGEDVSIVIGGYNTGILPSGEFNNVNTQPNFDNVRLIGTFDDPDVIPPPPTPPSAALTIHRQSGVISLSNTGPSNLNILGYSLTSNAGAFNQAEWDSVADNYDDTPGDGSVDNDDEWTILTAPGSTTNLSESELSGGDGGILTTTTPINLGDAWLRTPHQDVGGSLLLSDGTSLPVTVGYTGLVIPSGDLNGDGDVTGVDWTLFKAGQGTNFTGMSTAQAYLKGDLTGNKSHDLGDFFAFKTAYEAFNGGAGSFAQMLAGVPEPGSGLLLALGALLSIAGLRQRNLRGVFLVNRLPKMMVAALAAIGVCALSTEPAAAQTGVAYWSFDTPTLTIDSGNITGVADFTSNHNAVVGTAGTGGGTGTTHVSQAFPTATSSVTGQFGQGLRFAGNNFLLFPNLTELMEGTEPSAAPSYTVSMWYKMETPGATVGSAYAHLGNWGNQPAAAGPTRFTYGFGPHTNTQIRAQTRRTNLLSGNGGTDGTDIVAPSITVDGVNNGNWHMLTWTFNTDIGQLLTYYDGVLAGTTNAPAAAGPDYAMANSSSLVGGMGIKADSGTFVPVGSMLDEVYVFTGALTQPQITALFSTNTPPPDSFPTPTNLTLRVDPSDGQVEIRNDSEDSVTFSAYRITSSTGALNQAGWDAISTGTPVAGFPQGNGSGNGWEAPGEVAPNAADYNADGQVDAADYVMWRKTNVGGAGGYTTWRQNFGDGGDVTLGGDDNELVEWNLTGDSTLAVGESVSLGNAFDIGGAQNLTFQFTTSAGVKTGLISYESFGSGGGAVPEPSTAWLMLLAGCGIAACIWRRRPQHCHSMARVTACLVIASVAVSSATAAVTNDRIYRFGENGGPPQTQENGVATNPVGSGAGNPAPGTTLDHAGPVSGTFQTLSANSCNNIATCPLTNSLVPVYQDLSLVGTGRTGLGILFDGTDDYLNGFALGFAPITRSTARHTTTFPSNPGTGSLNYDGIDKRGMQFWAYPHSGATVEQHLVSDTTEHGVRISSGGNWMLRHGGTNVNSNVPVAFNQWSHVMAVIPNNSNPHLGILYVNGVALAAQSENYLTTQAVQSQALIVGADTNADGTMIGRNNFFRGVLDELEMFVWGRRYDPATNSYVDFGTFDFATDNEFAAGVLTGEPGDVDSNGVFNQDDVDDFVAGWLNEKRVNNIRVGDLTTFAAGDLNLDGITNLPDAYLMMDALGGGAGGFDLSGFGAATGVPEPSSLWLAGLAASLLAARRRANRQA